MICIAVYLIKCKILKSFPDQTIHKSQNYGMSGVSIDVGCSEHSLMAAQSALVTVRSDWNNSTKTDPTILGLSATLNTCLPSTTVNALGLCSFKTHLPTWASNPLGLNHALHQSLYFMVPIPEALFYQSPEALIPDVHLQLHLPVPYLHSPHSTSRLYRCLCSLPSLSLPLTFSFLSSSLSLFLCLHFIPALWLPTPPK